MSKKIIYVDFSKTILPAQISENPGRYVRAPAPDCVIPQLPNTVCITIEGNYFIDTTAAFNAGREASQRLRGLPPPPSQ